MSLTHWGEVGRMDDLARMDSPAHRLDARAKTWVTLVFVAVVMSFPRYAVSELTPFLLYPVVTLALGRIPIGAVAWRILLAAPFVLSVGILNPFFDRTPVAVVGPILVTGGWMSFISILLRFVLTVGAALALLACTSLHRLCAGLAQIGVPSAFVAQLLFLHRYLFVVFDEAAKMRRSAELRSGGARRLRFRAYGSLVGHLLLRAMDRADRIYRAMVSRGFDGEIRVSRTASFGWADAAFVCGWLVYFAIARTWNLAGTLGRFLTGAAS